jgi:WS/DGAT/MGAT family acyltransferase
MHRLEHRRRTRRAGTVDALAAWRSLRSGWEGIMDGYFSERLSARDNLFLVAETDATPMHIAAVQVIEAGPLRRPEGGIDAERLTQALDGVLHLIPRYRQKLRFPRLGGRPVWVDDPHFDLGYHVRHVRLPQPGAPEQLKCEAARILELPLDRARPLWELWIVEGLAADEQFALVTKIHHCMLDGMAGADLAAVLASPDPDAEVGTPEPYQPRPMPSSLELIRDEWRARAQTLGGGVAFARRGAAAERARGAARRVAAIRTLAARVLRPVSPTELNGPTGPHRSVDWLTLPLGEVREVKKMLSCTVNDLVLATLAGGLRNYLLRRGIDPARLDLRVATPVNMRSEGDRGKPGNFLSSWVVSLPVGEPAAEERLAAVCRTTLELKQSRAELAIDTLFGISEAMPEAVLSLAVRAAPRSANLLVTNVPGPQFPLYQLGARLLGLYPLAPCLPGSGLAIALFSYDGKLCWGFNADPERVPDLGEFTREIDAAYRDLATLALTERSAGAPGAGNGSTPYGVHLARRASMGGQR